MDIDDKDTLQQAGATAFGAAAAKAHTLSAAYQTEMQTTTRLLIECQLSKMSLKLSHFQEMEALLDAEVRHVESERIKLYNERMALKNGIKVQNIVEVEVADVEMVEDASFVLLQQ